MPLFELYQMTNGTSPPPPLDDDDEDKNKPSSSSFVGRAAENHDDLVELVWENGQVLMQGQGQGQYSSSRAGGGIKKFPPHPHSPMRTRCDTQQQQDHHHHHVLGNQTSVATTATTTSTRAAADSMGTSRRNSAVLPISVPSHDMDEDEEIAPWLHYPIPMAMDDHQPDYYYSHDLLPPDDDISGVTAHDPASGPAGAGGAGNTPPIIMSNYPDIGCEEATTRPRGSSNTQLYSSPLSSYHQQQQVKSKDGIYRVAAADGPPQPSLTSTGSALLNFSHFLRPATKAASIARADHKDKPLLDDNLEPFMTIEPPPHPAPAPATQEDVVMNNECQFVGDTSSRGPSDTSDKIVAASSVCSANSAEERGSDDLKRKRHGRDNNEESECPSEDGEDESVSVKKATSNRGGGAGSKRSRAAEVHNLSERRRRDRINEKMRALQELIPNCNKVDKASMLDEAIEYLKTLQLQVQIMSMGNGMYMPQMMLPPGMQHMHAAAAAHMAHFSPMGVGMGMGMGMGMAMGYGVGMPDMNGTPFAGLYSGAMPGGTNLPLYGYPPPGPNMNSSSVASSSKDQMQQQQIMAEASPKQPTMNHKCQATSEPQEKKRQAMATGGNEKMADG